MRRREFIGLVGGAAAVWPLAWRKNGCSMPFPAWGSVLSQINVDPATRPDFPPSYPVWRRRPP